MSEAHRKRLSDPAVRSEMEENLALGRELANSPEGRARNAERMRAARTGAVMSPETREKLRQANLGKVHPPEVRAKIADGMREAHASGRHPGPSRESLTRFKSKVEDAFAELLDALGIRYERQFFAHVPGAGRHPWDFALPDRRILIEVDGCYWHGCEECGFEGVDGRAALDEKQTRAAEAAGWKVVRVAEHDVGRAPFSLRFIEYGSEAGIFDAVE